MAARHDTHSRAAARVRALDTANRDDRALRSGLVDEMRRHVGFDSYAWLLTDPETEVGTAPLADVPALADLPRLIRAKYLTPTNRWTALAAPVATLLDATKGDREQSFVWREVLAAYGVHDVASLVFRDQHGCWGWLDLWRGDGAFSPAEQAYLTAIAAPVTTALRGAQARTFASITAPPARAGPAVLVLSHRLEVRAQTPDTERYLRTLVPAGANQPPVPAGAYNVAAQLLAVEAGVDGHPPRTRVHLTDGVWMTLRAARVDSTAASGEPDIAVTIEPASLTERRTLFTMSHGLTPRETELVELLAHGADTRTAAAQLFLSEHTVQDHLKSIFAKTGSRNRRTLLSRLAGG